MKTVKTYSAIFILCFILIQNAAAQMIGTPYIHQNLSASPAPYPPSVTGTIDITTYVNVMYDFQHQDVFVYNVGSPVSYQWFAKRRGEADTQYKAISGATAINYTVPADFVKNVYCPLIGETKTDYNDGIVLSCVATYSNGTFRAGSIDMEFIDTKDYPTRNGVKFIYLRTRNPKVDDDSNTSGRQQAVALVNLGANEGNDAADLGDFYQWGRIADGHQKVVWSKNPTTRENQITPMNGGSTTSAVIPFRDGGTTPSYNSSNHQVASGKYYGKFISTGTDKENGNYDWYYTISNDMHDDGLWGNASGTGRSNVANSWTYPSNNPCPTGWKVPDRFQIWDIFSGNGSNNPYDYSGSWTNCTGSSGNCWKWRASNGTDNTAVGGAIITNTNTNQRVFLPALGSRVGNSGSLKEQGKVGYYWSSSFYVNPGAVTGGGAYTLNFHESVIHSGDDDFAKASGFCVRGMLQ